jgi:hypothetical protein
MASIAAKLAGACQRLPALAPRTRRARPADRLHPASFAETMMTAEKALDMILADWRA